MTTLDTMMGLCLGIGLSAACGLRVFLPLLSLSVASHLGWIPLAASFQWVASPPAMVALIVATFIEVTAYFVPWLDNCLDSLSGPAAVLAGTLITASQLDQLNPLLQWGLALIAGGGTAGVVQGTTSLLRGTSTMATAGLGNPLVASAELGGAVLGSLFSLSLPVLAASVVLGGMAAGTIILWRRRARQRQESACHTC
ncbi:MAG TPA: DUF4126 domain-containing protein [Verrucomicrobiota bacterium]|nr:DUF4126 domain-containing protein [Verrucomicrobiota bacterium]HRZ38659.1 DUF4126 domain-containing protein [Candidatus Paceibacterota bacterium]HRZ55700.1 DUF4126 domain-containing protein [Candidatus Paceibacterota bacterium]